MKNAILGLLTLTLCLGTSAQQIYDTNNPVVSTFAGSGYYGYVDGTGYYTMFYNPQSCVCDTLGNIYVWDAGNQKMRIVTQGQAVATLSTLYFSSVVAMTLDAGGNFWTVDSSGGISKNGFGMLPTRSGVSGICVDNRTNVYFSDTYGNKVYRYDGTNATVFVGSGNAAYGDGWSIFSGFNNPKAMACDRANNIYVWDSANYLIRKIDQSSNVTTFTGTYQKSNQADGAPGACGISSISQMCFDASGNLILACGNCIRKVSPTGFITTIAGSFSQPGYTNDGSYSLFSGASGVCVYSNSIFVADTQNQRIREISYNSQPQAVPPSNLAIATYPGITIKGAMGKIYQIQTSPDMNTWTTAATVLLNSTPYLWFDQSGGPKKFYRAVMMP